MNPILMRHTEAISESFKAWTNGNPYKHNPWHYHPECEITFVNKGSGALFIGDKVMKYSNDELVIIGPNLPHEWRSDFKDQEDFYSESYAVHFKKDFIGEDFYKVPEANLIGRLLDAAGRGLKVSAPGTRTLVKEKLIALLKAEKMERINLLLSILNDISVCSSLEFLSSVSFVNSIQDDSNFRMNKIYKYVMTNFKYKLSIAQVAEEVCMTHTSFCRFFKRCTNKSFVQYVNEIRVGYACKLLFEQQLTVSQIAFECGFENLSNFNKQFKRIKNLSPREYICQALMTKDHHPS